VKRCVDHSGLEVETTSWGEMAGARITLRARYPVESSSRIGVAEVAGTLVLPQVKTGKLRMNCIVSTAIEDHWTASR
jgi:hypothetical protein